MSTLHTIKETVLDMLFPRYCIACSSYLNTHDVFMLCNTCSQRIEFLHQASCLFCEKPSPLGATCTQCQKHHMLDRHLALTSYKDPAIQSLIKTFKYKFAQQIAQDIETLVIRYCNTYSLRVQYNSNTIIVPVPLSTRRLRWRGFNQAELIADAFSTALGFPIITDALYRTHQHYTQAEISKKEIRQLNVANIFSCANHSSIAGKNIILIDDVATTGATLDACAKALKDAGASTITAITFTHG